MNNIPDLYQLFRSCTGFSTDTRKIEDGQMFFCLKGANFNGNKFAEDAVDKGAKYVIIDEPEYQSDAKMILVDDVLEAMQKLANYHRKKFDIPVLGITGTNGKTTTKELIYCVLSKKFKTHATQGNFNNHLGVPITLLSMPDETEFAIIEMGANHRGEIAELCKIAEPNLGLITSIGKAHLEGFGNLQGVIETKNELYKFILNRKEKLFVNADNKLLLGLSEQSQRMTYGQGQKADVRGEMFVKEAFVGVRWSDRSFLSQLVGSYNFENIMAAICLGEAFDVPKDKIEIALKEYTPKNQRSQLLVTKNNRIVVDAYNANPTSVAVAIDSFQLADADSKLLILGDMLELGSESEKEHIGIVEKILDLNFEDVFLVGPEFSKVGQQKGIRVFKDNMEVLDYLKNNKVDGKLILLKGSRGIALEVLLEEL